MKYYITVFIEKRGWESFEVVKIIPPFTVFTIYNIYSP